MSCRICFEEESDDNIFVTPCACKGDAGIIHEKCLKKWIETSDRTTCEICNEDYCQKDVPSIQIKKYFSGCIQLECNQPNLKLFISTMLLSCTIFLVSNINDLTLFTSITTGVMYFCAIAFFVGKYFGSENVFSMDSLLIWKLSYTICLFISCIFNTLNTFSACQDLCFIQEMKACNASCFNYHNIYKHERNRLIKLFIFDLINLGSIIIIRAFILCHKYNKKTVFSNYHEGEEDSQEPLLSEV